MELPIACSLEAVDLTARRDEWRRLIACHLQARTETSSGVRLTFSWTPEVEPRLGRLVEQERRCCAFARWTLTYGDDEIALTVDAEGDGIGAIQESFRG